MAFKKADLLKPIKFSSVEKRYQWNQNTANFEKVEIDVQKEIDVYKNCDLKSMIARNIMPNSENKGVYADTTIFESANFHNVNDALQTELIFEKEYEKDKNVINQDIKQDTNNDTKDNKDSNVDRN